MKYRSIYLLMILLITSLYPSAFAASTVIVQNNCSLGDVVWIQKALTFHCWKPDTKIYSFGGGAANPWNVKLNQPDCKYGLQGTLFVENECDIPPGDNTYYITINNNKLGCWCTGSASR